MDESSQIAGLQRLAAGRDRPIIRLGEKSPFAIVTVLMDEAWKQRFDAMHPTLDVLSAALEGAFTSDECAVIWAKHRRLSDGLLAFGGERVVMPS